jgi:hypothetical protein
MKQMTILSLAVLFLTAGVVKSQAPMTETDVATSLQTMVTANKTLIEKQQATLDGLDALDKAAQDLKTFAKRS